MEDYNNNTFDYKGKYIKLISMYADKEDELIRLECEILALKREIESLERFNHLIINAVDEARDVMLGE